MFPSLGLHGGQAPSHGVNTVSKYRRKDSAIRVSQSPSQPLSVFLGGGGGVLFIYFFAWSIKIRIYHKIFVRKKTLKDQQKLL